MKVYVVYESMYGNTHRIAEAIGEGLGGLGEVVVGSVALHFTPLPRIRLERVAVSPDITL